LSLLTKIEHFIASDPEDIGSLDFFLKDIKMIGTGKVSADGDWKVAGSVTKSWGALAVNIRDTVTADAMDTKYTVKINNKHPSAYAFLFRFRSDGNADQVETFHLYAARGKDHYHRIAKLSAKIGTQDTDEDTFHFCDFISPDYVDTLFDGEGSDDLENMIGHYYIRTLGFDKFLLVCHDISGDTVYVDYCPLYE